MTKHRALPSLLFPCLVLFSFPAVAGEVSQNVEPVNSGDPRAAGVTADRVENVTINNYLTRRRDPQRQALASVMIRFNSQMHELLASVRSDQSYLVLYDPRDPFFHVEGQPGKSYLFYAGSVDFIDYISPGHVHRCAFQRGYQLIGTVGTARISSQLNVSEEPLSLDDPLFQALCDSLGSDARQSWGGSAENAGDVESGTTLSNYDVLSRASGNPITLQFMPGQIRGGTYEANTAREYWAGALLNVDYAQPNSMLRHMMDSQVGRARATAIETQAAETGSLSLSFDYSAFMQAYSFDGLSAAANRYFGTSFADMDLAWRSALASASVIVNSRAIPLVANGRPTEVLQRFGLRDIGSPRFWSHLSDGGQYLQSLSCVATIFAVDNDYATSANLSAHAGCVSAQQSR